MQLHGYRPITTLKVSNNQMQLANSFPLKSFNS